MREYAQRHGDTAAMNDVDPPVPARRAPPARSEDGTLLPRVGLGAPAALGRSRDRPVEELLGPRRRLVSDGGGRRARLPAEDTSRSRRAHARRAAARRRRGARAGPVSGVWWQVLDQPNRAKQLSRGIGVGDVHVRVRQGRANGLPRAEVSRARRRARSTGCSPASCPIDADGSRLDQRHLQGRGTRRQSAARRLVRVLRQRAGRRPNDYKGVGAFMLAAHRARSMSVLDQFSLAGKRALVTGASRGLGRAMAIALAEAGADVVCASSEARRRDGHGGVRFARSAARRGRCTPISPIATRCDAMAADVERRRRPIDILVNNGGYDRAPSGRRVSGSTIGIACCARTSTRCGCSASASVAQMIERRFGKDHQHRVAALVQRRHHGSRVHGEQARGRRPHQGARQRVGAAQRADQRDRAGLFRDRQHAAASR